MKINIEINGEIFEADIENSSTGKAFYIFYIWN